MRRIDGIPEAPLASRNTLSLVLMSPSIVIRLNDSSTASNSPLRSVSAGIAASVVTKHSIVAMLGEIMPAPLTQPPSRTRCCPSSNEIASSLGRVSLVMIARATAWPPSRSSPATSSGRHGSMRAIGSGRPITPVEATPTSVRRRPRPEATQAAMVVASRIPWMPVQALALPLLATIARSAPPRRWVWLSLTGAALTRLVVNAPAAAHGRSE